MTNWQSDLDALIAETKAFVEKAGAKRLADEYDAAQDRGELRSNGERSFSSPEMVSGTELVPPNELHEARLIRDGSK